MQRIICRIKFFCQLLFAVKQRGAANDADALELLEHACLLSAAQRNQTGVQPRIAMTHLQRKRIAGAVGALLGRGASAGC